MKRLSKSRPAILLMAGLLLLSCSSSTPSAARCEQAAISQAIAEQRWQEEFEKHNLAHDALAESPESSPALDEHDHSAEALFSARVDMILAEAETRRECG